MLSHSRPLARLLGVLTAASLCASIVVIPAPAVAGVAPAPVTRLADASDARIAPGSALHALGAGASVSGDDRIDSLLSGYRYLPPASGPTTITYSFYEDDVWHGLYPGPTEQDRSLVETGCREVSSAVKSNVRAALAWYATLMNVDFVEVTETTGTVGQLRYLLSDTPNYAYAYYPGSTSMWSASSDVHLRASYDNSATINGFQRPGGDHGYLTIVHETGHALGLKHPFEGAPNLPIDEDNDSHTIMTYTWNGSSAATPMAYDIMALQYLYGTRTNHATDDTYCFTARGTSQYTRDGVTTLSSYKTLKQAIWDNGGVNDLDCAGLPAAAGGYRFDLRPLGWLSTVAGYGTSYFNEGTALGPNVTIRNIVGSGSDDTIYANSSANIFGGYAPGRTTSDDTIWEASSADTVDLSAFDTSEVATAAVGDDLVISLGAIGSITVKEWRLGHQPLLAFSPPVPNEAPIPAISASATSGISPLSVTFGAGASTDPDGEIVQYAWSFGDGTTATGPTASKTYGTPGSYTVELTVTDDDGASATTSLVVTALPQQPLVHVGAISLTQLHGARWSSARVRVTLTDANGAPVAGATVIGHWSGLVPGGVAGVSDAQGRVDFTSMRTAKVGTVHFTVTSVTPPAGRAYAPERNAATMGSVRILR